MGRGDEIDLSVTDCPAISFNLNVLGLNGVKKPQLFLGILSLINQYQSLVNVFYEAFTFN